MEEVMSTRRRLNRRKMNLQMTAESSLRAIMHQSVPDKAIKGESEPTQTNLPSEALLSKPFRSTVLGNKSLARNHPVRW